ncbi:hypothetical protein DL98DRAFT_589555 [Cadophora sp. DSE1049]|nr:hypothetical protein DL98DRAFT_589555 [Cadophora sp. DSE1049]
MAECMNTFIDLAENDSPTQTSTLSILHLNLSLRSKRPRRLREQRVKMLALLPNERSLRKRLMMNFGPACCVGDGGGEASLVLNWRGIGLLIIANIHGFCGDFVNSDRLFIWFLVGIFDRMQNLRLISSFHRCGIFHGCVVHVVPPGSGSKVALFVKE